MLVSVYRVGFLSSASWLLLVTAFASGNTVLQIQQLLAAKDWLNAQLLLSSELSTHPGDSALWNLRGILEANQGRTESAEEAFFKAVQLDSRLAAAWLNLGRLRMLDTKQPNAQDLALAAFQSVLKLDPSNAEAHHQSALILEWKAEFSASLRHLNQLSTTDRNRRGALAIRCADEASLGHTDAALAVSDALLNDPELEEADVLSILPALSAHNSKVAIHLLKVLVSRNLSSAVSKGELARLYEQTGRLEDARKLYEATWSAGPPDPVAALTVLIDIARVAFRQKDFEGALGFLGHARDLDPARASTHFFFGLTCNELRLPLEARKSLEKAVQLEPDNPSYNYALGAVLLQWREADIAIPYLLKFTAAEPKDRRGQLALASAYLRIDRDDDAEHILANVSSGDTLRASFEYLQSQLAAHRGNRAEAITHLRAVIALEPGAAEAHAQLGANLFDQRDLSGAAREAQAALAVDPENRKAHSVLMSVYREQNDPRLPQQIARYRSLVERGDEEMKLLLRSVEVRPW